MKEDEEEHEEIVVICPPFMGRDEASLCILTYGRLTVVYNIPNHHSKWVIEEIWQ